jgi:hypothetical protein
MKNLLLPIFLLSFLTGSGQNKSKDLEPETKDHKHVKTIFGFKGGYNNSVINGRELSGAKTGYTGGELYGAFFADTRITKKISFENELLFSWTDDYHFIEIPLHLKFTFAGKWNVFAGPKLDIIADKSNAYFESGRFDFRHFGVSGELGVQYNFTRWFFAETRYSKGFTKQVNDSWLDINGGKRNTFRIGAGIKF